MNQHLAFLLILSIPFSVNAFQKDQRVWIDLPAVNINDDSYGEGSVVQDTPSQSQVSVYVQSLTTSKAFSSGVFCAAPSQSSEGWESPAVYNVITNEVRSFPRQQLRPWTEGYNHFYERQNWLYTFLKWSDHHPVIERSQLQEHQKRAQERGNHALAAVNALMVMEYDAYQTPQFKPFNTAERIQKLIPVLEHIEHALANHTQLNQVWRAKQRDQALLNSDPYILFMTQAIDKILLDARKQRRLLLEKDLNNTSATFDDLMRRLERT